MNIVELVEITKTFGSTVANDKVNLSLKRGEILALLGENGSGKTTLMNILSGLYYQDSGKIFINDEEVFIKTPNDAAKYKIAMIHQHFRLINLFSAVDNIILGEKVHFDIKKEFHKLKNLWQPCLPYYLNVLGLPFRKIYEEQWLKKSRADRVQRIVDRYGFNIDISKKIYNMSVSEKQTVEILKALYRGADILILDEPTAVLTPQEIKNLFKNLRRMQEDGKSIIIITHKLNEVMEISDRVAILRKGRHIATVEIKETQEEQLTELMVGDKIDLNIKRSIPVNNIDRVKIQNLSLKNSDGRYSLKDISFDIKAGEILGIAGISGSGQKELLESIAGLNNITSGSVTYFDPEKNNEPIDLRKKTPTQIVDLGVRLSFVPEDRLGMGLVANMDLTDNMMLRSYDKGSSFFVDRKAPKELAEKIVEDLGVVTPSVKTPVRKLSGGNVQKVLVGREIAAAPTVLMAAYPVRGLDINSSYTIYNLLNKQKEQGVAVVFVGEDLDVLLAISDRILVMCDGRISGVLDARNTTKDKIGLLMTSIPKNIERFDGIYKEEVVTEEILNQEDDSETSAVILPDFVQDDIKEEE